MQKALKNVYIAKTAVATGLGDTLLENWRRLIDGHSAVGPIDHFSTARLPYHLAACASNLRSTDTENHTIALLSRVLECIKPIPADTFIIWTGIKGNAEYIEIGKSNPEKSKRGQHLPIHYRNWVADYLNINMRGMEINAACAASTVGLALGAQKIAQGEERHVLVCAADLVTRFAHTGFSALKALTKTACRPFDQQRDGMCLGDGAFAILLTDDEGVRGRRQTAAVRMTGWGISNDAVHITGPARDGRGLIAAIQASLQMAALDPDELEAFGAHGTGTRFNDAMELTAIQALFGFRRFPLFSIKGALGHTLGAAGGIETALCAQALHERLIPPTTGLQTPEERAVGRVSNGSQPFDGHTILTTNSGFGGVNAALLLSKEA